MKECFVDFEKAVWLLAFEKEFGIGGQIFGCGFHWTQCIFRRTSYGNQTFLKCPKISESYDETDDLRGIDSQNVHHNQPALRRIYRDPEIKKEILIILALLPGGVTDVEF